MNGFRVRSMLLAVVTGVVAAALTFVVFRAWSAARADRGRAELVVRALHNGELQRCETAPERWSFDSASHARFYSYDGDSLESRAPAAPWLRPDAVAALALAARSEGYLIHDRGWFDRGGVIVIRAAPTGPCALVAAPVAPLFSRGQLGTSAALTVASGVLSALLAWFGGVLPTARRIARLKDAATYVGDATRYAPVEPASTDDLGVLASALQRAHERIRADAHTLERKQRAVLSHVADLGHDVRTPLASLQLGIEQALMQNRDEEIATILTGAACDVVYLTGLIANLRLETEMRDGVVPTRGRVDLCDVTHRAVGRLRFIAAQRGIEIHAATPDERVEVWGDVVRIEQAIANIVDNAVTHGRAGGHAALRLLVCDGGTTFELVVIDDGPGVAASDIPRLRDRAFRTRAARERDSRGSGLGLAISGAVCEEHGWTLNLTRESPSGLRVSLRGPLASDAGE